MAHFAQLDENNNVINVIVISNDVTHDEDGVEQEGLGIAFCKSLFGEDTKWVQTSYNGNIRGHYAGLGDIYDEAEDVFVPAGPRMEFTTTPEVVLTETIEDTKEIE